MIFRDRETPYAVPFDVALAVARTYFIDNPPAAWLSDDSNAKTYARIYGDAALVLALSTGKVAENRDKNFVGNGGQWNDGVADPQQTIELPANISPVDALILSKLDQLLARGVPIAPVQPAFVSAYLVAKAVRTVDDSGQPAVMVVITPRPESGRSGLVAAAVGYGCVPKIHPGYIMISGPAPDAFSIRLHGIDAQGDWYQDLAVTL